MEQRLIYHNGATKEIPLYKLIDPVIARDLDKVKHRVLKNDRDWVGLVDGEEGSGKSVLAQQIASYLDPNFTLENITFNSDDFIKMIKDPKTKMGSCIVLDEAFSSANSRASMSEVNRSLIGVATEMRQKNLFVIIVLPSFFDLDRYFALWRCRALFHVYFNEDETQRRYIIFPKNEKKYLYLAGKKTYSYAKPRSPYPACTFPNWYTVNEEDYREKKANAFKKRTVSNQAKRWFQQRNTFIKYIYQTLGLTQEEIGKIPTNYGIAPIHTRQIAYACAEDNQI